MRLPGRTLSHTIVGPDGDPATLIESLPISEGQRIILTFESVGPRWQQGVFIATAGVLRIGELESAQWTLWSESAPPTVDIEVLSTDGSVTFYNVWDSGRGYHVESQKLTSGMYVELLDSGVRRYSCNDIGRDPDFSSLVFTVEIGQP